MTAEYGYVWFLPAWFTERWWDTDKHNAAFPTEKVPCTSMEMLSAIQGHFILTTAFLGEENSQIVGNCTVRNWLEAYLEHLQALVGVSRHSVCVCVCVTASYSLLVYIHHICIVDCMFARTIFFYYVLCARYKSHIISNTVNY